MEAAIPGAGAIFVAQLQDAGFISAGQTVEDLVEWPLLASLDINGIDTNFIEEGVVELGN